MSREKLLQLKKRGSAMALMLMVLVILLAMGAGLLGLGTQSRMMTVRTATEIAARCAADAGLTKALFEMNELLKIKPWNDDTLPQASYIYTNLSDCGATYSLTVKGGTNSRYTIESTGRSGRAERKVNSTLRLKGLFEHAIAAKGTIVLKNGITVDGYNSADASDTDIDVAIATASTSPGEIVLNIGVTVDGDILVGVDSDPATVIKDHGATITGDSYAMEQEIEFPPITAPLLTDMGTEISAQGTTVTIGPADSGTYTEISLTQLVEKDKGTTTVTPSTLEVDGGDVVLHVTGDVWLSNSCEIVVKPGSSLTLYLDGDMVTGNSAGINNQNYPASFKVYGTGQDQKFDIKAKGDFRGAIYAPDAKVSFNAWGDIYGSVSCYDFGIGTPSNFHYDASLREGTVNDEMVRFVVERWSEQ